MPSHRRIPPDAFRHDGQPNAGRKPRIIPLIERAVRLVKRNPNKLSTEELREIVSALRAAADEIELSYQ